MGSARHNSGDMLVSVPCNCGAEVGPLDTRCRACNTPVSGELREAVDASLEAAHPEYREAKQRVRGSAMLLLVVGLLYVGYALLAYFVSGGNEFLPPTQEESTHRIAALVENMVIGSMLLGCYFVTKRAPRTAFVLALGVWIAIQLVALAIAPSTVLLAFLSALGIVVLMGRIVVFVLLVRAAVAAHRLHRIRAEVAVVKQTDPSAAA